MPVDYVADRVHELATNGPAGTFHLVAGRAGSGTGAVTRHLSHPDYDEGVDDIASKKAKPDN